MTDTESLARDNVSLLSEVQEANNLIRACVPRLLAAHAACVDLCTKHTAKSIAADDEGEDGDMADEADNAAAKYRFLVGFIEELTERYA